MASGPVLPSTPEPDWWAREWARWESSPLTPEEPSTSGHDDRSAMYPLRSSQLDARRLDAELFEMVTSGVATIASTVGPRGGSLVAGLLPEMNAIIGLTVFAISSYRNGNTPGAALLNLRYANGKGPAWTPGREGGGTLRTPYRPPRAQIAAFYALSVGVKYAWARLLQWSASRGWATEAPSSWRRKAWDAMKIADRAYVVLRYMSARHALRTSRGRGGLPARGGRPAMPLQGAGAPLPPPPSPRPRHPHPLDHRPFPQDR